MINMILQGDYEALDFGLFSKGYIFFILIGLVIQIGIIVWVVKDAKSRGIDPTLWGILTCFFGWISCLIYLVTRKGKTKMEQQPVYDSSATG